MIYISENDIGQRIDNFLFKNLKGVPKSRIYRMIRKGEVRVNSKRVKSMYKLNSGDVLRVPNVRMSEKEQIEPGSKLKELIEQSIIFENKNIVIINKLAGIASHAGSGIKFGVIEIIRSIKPEFNKLELVHRLDRATSGCLILAKKRSVLISLHDKLKTGSIEKTYLALLRGKWQGGSLLVNKPIYNGSVSYDNKLAKNAITEFTPVKIFTNYSLMKVRIKTGRMHQIRIHSAYLSRPIANDDKYGDREFNRYMKKLGLKRMFLHAVSIKFYSEFDKKNIYIEADLDDNLKAILE